ncbi:MAG: hypothetical protein AB7S56_01210 [Halothiobacillaceae bacterium]
MNKTAQKNKRMPLNPSVLIATFALVSAGSLALSGCSSPKSEMADAINKSLAENPQNQDVSLQVKLPQLDTRPTNEKESAFGLVLPDEKNTAIGKALDDLASAKLIGAQVVEVYPKKNTGFMSKDEVSYVLAMDKASLDSPSAKEIMQQLKQASPGAVWSDLGDAYYIFGSQGYVATTGVIDSSIKDKVDPNFFAVVKKNQSTSPMAKRLIKLAENGYLLKEEKKVYAFSDIPFLGEWTGDPKRYEMLDKEDVFLFFITDKGKGVISANPFVPNMRGVRYSPSVKVAESIVNKILSIDVSSNNFSGKTVALVDFEETKVLTDINKTANLELKDPDINNGKPILSQAQIVEGEVVSYKPSEILSTNPIQAVSYTIFNDVNSLIMRAPFDSGSLRVDLGQWKLKSVDNFSKEKNAFFGGQIAQCTFQFEYNPKIKPLLKQLAALGLTEKDLPKSNETKPFDCVVTAMEKGFTSMGCSPSSGKGGF